ncbi:MAG: MFS transporter, partial [Betaproteobacteria bacterium]|nr:MFS transporter [Betaproteobacteria bacterium]
MKTAFRVLSTISLAHCLNDTTQSLLIAIYPLLRDNFGLNYTQLGFLSFTYQMCASVLQPLIGSYADKHPMPYSLPVGMSATLFGLLIMAIAPGYFWLLIGSAMVGIGSAVFHPESSRVAHAASAGRYGLAQSIFQVGGNAGAAFGPLLAALFVMQHGQISLAFFALLPLAAIISLVFI